MARNRWQGSELWLAAAIALAAMSCGGTNPAGLAGGDGGGNGHGADSMPPADFGPPRGTVDPTGLGGSVNLLGFTVFGDVRPSIPDYDAGYPTSTITSIMQGMDALHPEFAVGSGDYMFVEYWPASATNQLKLLQGAEANLHAPIFHALGNHECNSFSDSNCPMLNESPNITAFMSMLLPWSKVPWYSFIVHTDLGDAKFVFVAVSAWTDTQGAWLDTTMQIPTKYTFIVRHHPTPDAGHPSCAAGVPASDAILTKYPETLFLYGHVHEYTHLTPNAAISGNAGAPLDSGDYGYLYVLQRPDGNISVTEYKQGTNAPVDSFAVTPDGKATM